MKNRKLLTLVIHSTMAPLYTKQAISASEQALCQLTVCFDFQSGSDRRKGHKSYAMEMVLRRKVTR